MRTLQNNTAPLLISSALLVAGFIGASAVAIGLRELLGIEPQSIWPFDLVWWGALLGALSWRASRSVLQLVDDAPRLAAASLQRSVVGLQERSFIPSGQRRENLRSL
jgi:hypothetical protein